jgi:hypothetical protein
MRTGHAAAVCVLLVFPGVVAACADILSIDAPIPITTPDSSLMTGTIVYEGGVPIDPFDAGVCAEVGPPSSGDFFVSTKMGSDNGSCGSRSAPCGSVGFGVKSAGLAGGGTVIVARGLYKETVVLQSNITIQGGWDEDFNWICDPEAVQIRAPKGSYTTILGHSVSATLESLTVTCNGAPPPDPPANTSGLGTSVYGIFMTGGSALTLNDVIVVTGPAGNGGTGASGPMGPAGSPDGCDGGGGGMGGLGTPGLGGQVGTFEMSGYTPVVGGTGGIGGNGGSSSSGACGGGGGPGGTGGGGGGCSIAVYLTENSTVMATGGLFQSGNGGNGGTGGGGGPGGSPGSSKAGPGGTGGTGGGGASGCSFDVAGNALGSIIDPALAHGMPGKPGQGGNPGAMANSAGVSNNP